MMISFDNKVARTTGGVGSPRRPVLRVPHGSASCAARGGRAWRRCLELADGADKKDLTARCGLNRSSFRADGETDTPKLQRGS